MAKDDLVQRFIDENNTTVVRRLANYQPNQWDYNAIRFITNNFTEEAYDPLVKKLKEEVRALLSETEPVAQIMLIDSIEKLGLGYYFVEEIERLLNDMLISGYPKVVRKDGLHVTAVLYRLLRQHGLMISQDIFDYFKDDDGSFMASLSHDAKGLLSLYQASSLSFEEENTMDAARAFAATHLKTMNASEILSFAKEIAHEMELPSHWRPTRLEARRYIDIYEKEEDTNPTLLRFAKLDFNMVQNVHQRELAKVTSWWMNLGLGKKLGFARDRILECFFGVIIIVFQPQFGYCREWLAKVGALLVVVDDIYDAYGSLDELELFTRVVERWEIKELENLAECMKICFINISNIVDEMARNSQRNGGLDILPYLRKAAEQERGGSPTSIQCYMKENGVSEVDARAYISSVISQTWKELNQELILCSSLPQYFMEACTNLARMAVCLYQHRDGFGIPTHETKSQIKSLLITPIPFAEKGIANNSHQWCSVYQGQKSKVAL
ncbi:terpene synthase 10-like isoform X3 [Asparagus officinalis]|uniref:terpene synthase 10-like isoform X3 n=1 Tax=Asparagus officinalis TaxID=4686 RepID=UPI00098E793F|nr:terpene synthase 10-like isoform X3 [Asparagus officinalis]